MSTTICSATPLDVPQCDEDGVDWLDPIHWVRNPSDELAIENGCWFDAERAAHACYWMETTLKLYEDPFAGFPIRFNSTATDPRFYDGERHLFWDVPEYYEDAMPWYFDRMRRHNQLYAAGEFMHWHFEAVCQVYGWVRRSDEDRFRDPETGEGKIVRRFTKAMVWCAKKNGKSPFTAANALYLTCGDGEGGANVGFAASDLSQAKNIIGNHAFEMVAQSASLEEHCKPNKNECSVLHIPTRSRMFPISAGNERSANAQHGRNLSGGVIDEVHVCNKRVHDRMGRAFISRPEPLLWEVSTAGDNPESWGKTEFDKAEQIVKGELKVDHIYAAVYAAPQTATDKDIDKNIEEYLKMANPAMGHIVGLEQSLRDYNESKQTSADLALFKYEKLNIWVNSSVGWLAPGLYASCGGWTFEPADMQAPCVIGFDNARRVDLVAAVPTWEYWFHPKDANNPDNMMAGMEPIDPNDPYFDEAMLLRKGCIQRPIFWTNEGRIAELALHVPKIEKWVDKGLIRVCHGNANAEQQIAKDLYEFIRAHNVIGFVHDPRYCEFITEFLTTGMQDASGSQVYEPVLRSNQVVPMSQSTATQAGPVAAYEQDLKRELLGHEDHEVMVWQHSHANVFTDKDGSQRIQKESRKSVRTVDGVQAGIMGRWGLLDYGKFTDQRLNFYEENELEEL